MKDFRIPSRNVRKIQSRDSRRQRVRKADFTQEVFQEPLMKSPRVVLSKVEPRPTRRFFFKWNPHPNTLVITKAEGEPRKASWVRLSGVKRLLDDVGPSRPMESHFKMLGQVGSLGGLESVVKTDLTFDSSHLLDIIASPKSHVLVNGATSELQGNNETLETLKASCSAEIPRAVSSLDHFSMECSNSDLDVDEPL
ncbi:hypothetical protein FCV25MIE_30883 [Fagus crenata]